MEIDSSFCRLCFTHADEPIYIFGDATTEFSIVDLLTQYSLDQVTEDDGLPKVVCHDCWSQIETFHSFVQQVIAIREDYLRKTKNDCVKEEEVPDEFIVSMDETEIHQENVCVEPVSLTSGDPLAVEVELMDTKFQIDVESKENKVVPINDEESDDIWSNADQISNENVSNIKKLAGIDIDAGTELSRSSMYSQSDESVYICDICNKEFGSKLLVSRHLSTHSEKSKCHICGERFGAKNLLDHHIKSSHFGGLDGYEQEVKEMVLNVSEDQIKEAMNIFVHEKTCDLCSTEFSSFLDARSHYLKFHNSLGHIRCCSILLKSNNVFLDHIYWHFNPTVFECRLCHKDMKTRTKLVSHIKKHEAYKTNAFVCKYCEKSFEASFRLTRHMLSCKAKRATQPKSQSLPLDETSTEQPSSDGMSMNESTCDEQNRDVAIADYFDMKCDLCPVVFTSFDDAKSHYLDVHRMENGYLKCCNTKFILDSLVKDHLAWHQDPNVFRCNECNKSYLNRQGLVRHKKNHSRDFVCNICSKRYSTASNLTTHLQSHEKRKRSFICGVCNKGYYDKTTLDRHKKRHQQDRTHICEFCGKGFKSRSDLNGHVRNHDQMKNERQFQCNICHKWFALKHNLDHHMVTHSGPQKCDQCDKIAPNLSALKQHITASHCEPKFECHLCDKKFRLKPALKDHIATHKGEKNYKCTFCNEAFIWRTNMYAHRKKMHKEQWMAEKAKTEEKLLKA